MALVWLSPELGEELPARLAAASGTVRARRPPGRGRSVGWLLMYVGLPWVVRGRGSWRSGSETASPASTAVEVLGEPLAASALLAFRIAGWPAEDAAEELSHRAFAITDPEPDGELLRVSVGAWNSEEELDRFVARVAELARRRHRRRCRGGRR